MADGVSGPYRYSLGDLPMEPPDTFGTSYPSAHSNQMGVVPLGAPQGLPAGFGMRLPGRLPPGPFPMPGQPTPPIRMPEIPEWLTTLMAGLPKAGRGLRKGLRKGNMDICDQIHKTDQDKCHKRQSEGAFAHPDWYSGCLDNARLRWLNCRGNGGKPSEIPVWGPEHEEIYIDPDR